MAAFSSYQQYPFHFDSVFLQNPISIKNLSAFMDQEGGNNNNIINTNCFFPFYPPELSLDDDQSPPLDVISFHVDHNNTTSMVALSDGETSVANKQSTESSTVVDNKHENGEQVTQKRKHNISSARSKDGRRKKQKKCNSGIKEEDKRKPKAEKKVPEEAPTGYIHVRARRGQATDSHSLAERVRREKISERMKILQRLVPGCDKVTGKALMLDEIINYVQSLQNQVEFLSMKLASVNPLFYDFGMDLDALMVRPEGLMSSLASSLPPIQQCPQTRPTAFADATAPTITTTNITGTTIFATANNYPLIDNSSAPLLLQGQRPSDFIQDNISLLWGLEEQRQKFLNPSGFTNTLCSFH